MLRITIHEEGPATRFLVEGKLVRPWRNFESADPQSADRYRPGGCHLRRFTREGPAGRDAPSGHAIGSHGADDSSHCRGHPENQRLAAVRRGRQQFVLAGARSAE